MGPTGTVDDRADPWWDYYQPYLDDAGALTDQMRKLGSVDAAIP